MSDTPTPNEIEISVFGCGFGECILVHYNTDWFIIDSFILNEKKEVFDVEISELNANKNSTNTRESFTSIPVALKYLQSINVNLDQVKLILASHWHTDHTEGLCETIQKCHYASFFITSTITKKTFPFFKESERFIQQNPNSTHEVNSIFKYFKKNKKRKINKAYKELPLFKSKDIEIYSLSPSMETNDYFFNNLLKHIDQKIKAPDKDEIREYANRTSVVLLIKLKKYSILLGSDLEHLNDPEMGWNGVLNTYGIKNVKSHIFKIPHHGSENGHCEDIWVKHLIENPIAISTSFTSLVDPLPTLKDVERIKKYTNNAYLVANSHIPKIKIPKVLENMGATLPRENKLGHVRVRIDSESDEFNPKIETFHSAGKL